MATAVAQPFVEPAEPLAEPPAEALPRGPRLSPFALTVIWSLAPGWVMDQCVRRLGDSFTLTFFPSGRKLVMVSDPEAVKTVFTAPPEVAPSAAGASPIASIMGPSSVITLVGPEHMRQRKLLLPPFHGERMREYADVIVQATRRSMAEWPLDEPMKLSERTRSITLEVILRAVFGVEASRMDTLRDAIAGLIRPTQFPALLLFALRGPSLDRPGGSIGRALDHLDEVIYAEISRRRAQEDLGERADILSLLLLARDEDGQAMTDQELRDELVTLLLAGHETTATSVAWAIERLVRHPDKLARLVAEIDALSASPDRDALNSPNEQASDSPSSRGTGGDEYMQAVISETLRVRPVVPLVVRVLQAPLRVGARELPAGTRVVPSIYLTNRNPSVYDSPEEFRPERFLERAPETFSWIPFGGGIRRCIGASFATLEMKLILQTMLGELAPSLPARGGRLFRRGEWSQRRAITLVPAGGARVVWRRR
ncbi:MAG TPA: cytochrome P450 [Solirubrobacteraceae bacterium]|nr:cytochrome P450 [Solirubrobacteraceae bacterium]